MDARSEATLSGLAANLASFAVGCLREASPTHWRSALNSPETTKNFSISKTSATRVEVTSTQRATDARRRIHCSGVTAPVHGHLFLVTSWLLYRLKAASPCACYRSRQWAAQGMARVAALTTDAPISVQLSCPTWSQSTSLKTTKASLRRVRSHDGTKAALTPQQRRAQSLAPVEVIQPH